MKSKIFAISLLALFLIGIVSAVSYSVSPTTITITPDATNTTFTITNTNSSTLLNVNVPSTLTINGESGSAIFNILGSGANINASSPRIFTMTPTSSIDFSKFNLEKTYNAILNITEQGNSSNLQTINVKLQNSFCKAGDKGDLRVDYDITNKGKYGSDDEFYSFEDITVDVTVENRASDKINDVIVSWGIYNKRTGQFIVDDEEKKVDIKDKDEEIVTFSFKIDPNDLEDSDSEDDFVLYIKAYSDDEGEENQCNFKSVSITIPRDEDFVVIDPKVSFPSEALCSEPVEGRLTVWNIGDNTEDNVYVRAVNKELGLNQKIDAGDLDTLESKKVTFDFNVPSNATEKSYPIEFKVYNEDDEVFVSDNDDESALSQTLKVSGGCAAQKSADLTTNLGSDAVAGQELKVATTLRNTGSVATTYQILLNGYDSWATLQNIDPRSVTLSGGESRAITITLIPNKDATGDKEFTVQALYNGLITEQKVTVPITAKQGGITGFSISNLSGGSWFIWVIAALNVLLVILIIIIAVRIARK